CAITKLRRQARHLENDLEIKLVSFSKLSILSTQAPGHTVSPPPTPSPSSVEPSGLRILVFFLHIFCSLLQDYTQEFEKLSANFRAQHEREQLLSSAHRDMHVCFIMAAIEADISAKLIKWGMYVFAGCYVDPLTETLDRFPVINSLMQRIGIRKRRDALILGSVIGLCTIVLLLYALR
uniref:Golgi SNAP receptor complex member 1 n=1 Tax=Eptatretus burgeri TaxID=7764 RepID=A0A8C4R5T7_EPTBU